MKGNGNGVRTLLQKLLFLAIPTSRSRSNYIMKHADQFRKVGSNIFWQSRLFPSDPELIALGNNVMITSGVTFVNHDVISELLNRTYNTNHFDLYEGCIEIGNNVMIGANTMILPNVKIGDNVVIGAGSIVSKDIPSNSIAAGVPCKVIGNFEKIVDKYNNVKKRNKEELWAEFEMAHRL